MEILTNDTYDNALNAYSLGRFYYDRFIKRVSGLEPHVVARLVEAFDRSVRPVDERHNGLAVFGRLARFDYNEIAVSYVLVNHRIAAHSERERPAPAEHVGRDRDGVLAQDGLDGLARGDVPEQGYIACLLGGLLLDDLYATRGVRYARDQLLALKRGEQLVDSGGRAEAEMRADLSDRRRVPVRIYKAAEIIVDFTLTRR